MSKLQTKTLATVALRIPHCNCKRQSQFKKFLLFSNFLFLTPRHSLSHSAMLLPEKCKAMGGLGGTLLCFDILYLKNYLSFTEPETSCPNAGNVHSKHQCAIGNMNLGREG